MFEDVWKSYEANELSHSAAHHLMAIHELRKLHGYARGVDVSQHLKITKGSVSSTMKHLRERGYVKEDHNKFLDLTEKGLRVVQETEATRLVVQKFLSDALGMDDDDAEVDACKVEHLISSEARARLVCFLQFVLSDEAVARKFLAAYRERELVCRNGDVDECRLCEDVCYGLPELLKIEEES